MAKTSDDMFEDWPWGDDDKRIWQLMMSVTREGANLDDLKQIQITPVDNLDILLRSLQQAVLEIERANGSLQKQVQTFLGYQIQMRREQQRDQKRIASLKRKIKSMEEKK